MERGRGRKVTHAHDTSEHRERGRTFVYPIRTIFLFLQDSLLFVMMGGYARWLGISTPRARSRFHGIVIQLARLGCRNHE